MGTLDLLQADFDQRPHCGGTAEMAGGKAIVVDALEHLVRQGDDDSVGVLGALAGHDGGLCEGPPRGKCTNDAEDVLDAQDFL